MLLKSGIQKTVLAAVTLAIVVIFAVGVSAAAGSAPNVAEAPEVRVVIDGIPGNYTDVALKINDRVLLPFREVLTRLGVPNNDEHIIWNEEEESVTVINGDDVIRLVVGSKTMSLNGDDVEFDVAPYFYSKNNRTYVPVRAISELLDKNIMWEDATTTVYIRDKINFAETLELLKRMERAEQNKKGSAESEGTVKMKMSTDSIPLPGADEDGFLTMEMGLSQLVMSDLENNIIHIKQLTDIGGVNIGTEMFFIDNRTFMKIEGPGLSWTEVTGHDAYNLDSMLDQVNVLESQLNARELTDVAMGLASIKGPDGTYTLVGEPLYLADINAILDSLTAIIPEDGSTEFEMKFNKIQMGTTVSGTFLPINARVYADMDLSITEKTEIGNYITVYFNMEMNIMITYDQVGRDYEIAIPDDIIVLL